MSINYVTNIPFATHNPSSDQPNMEIDTNAVNQWTGIDHIPFNVGAGLVSGQHKQVTFNGFNVPGAQTTPNSVEYTNSTASTPAGQLFWVNSNATYHLSPIRAWGVFSPAGIVLTQTVNVASIVPSGVNQWTVTLNANVVASSSYGVIATGGSQGLIATYSITSATVFTIFITSNVNPTTITFMVLQL
jgi:hypothetical protein